jgi:hypothetical protein
MFQEESDRVIDMRNLALQKYEKFSLVEYASAASIG